MSASPFPKELRVEYDASLFDAPQRRAKARQLQQALTDAGLWRAPQRILDVGCGAGLTLAELDAPGAERIGSDVRREPFEQGGAGGRVRFTQADCAQLPFATSAFDLVMCLAVVGEFPDWRAAVAEMARCVRVGGCLYMTVANSPVLLKRYAVQEKIGRGVPTSWWSYARACAPLFEFSPAQGLGVRALARWEYVNVTPHLARAAYGVLRGVPLSVAERMTRYGAPALAYAWRRT